MPGTTVVYSLDKVGLDVAGIIDETGQVNDHTFITAMGLLRVGYDTIVGSSHSDTLRDKFNRILSV